jgi:hypothetical protein
LEKPVTGTDKSSEPLKLITRTPSVP